LLDKVKELESQLLSRDSNSVTISDEFQKSRKDVQSLTIENKNLQKSLNSEKKKEEYLERELAMMKEKYDNLK
jgi:regulator of replication initiation timing